MKIFTYHKKITWKTVIVFSALGMVTATAFVMPDSSIAASATPTPQAEVSATPPYPALTKAFQAEQAALTRQGANLDGTGALVTKIQSLVDQAKTKNLDTIPLENALASFQTRGDETRSAHTTAASIISTHAGFNVDGSVTDATAARQTVLDARQSLRQAASILGQAVRDLRSSITAWRNAIRDQNQTAVLKKTFGKERDRLTKQAGNLDKTNTVVTRMQALISNTTAKGLDTAELEAALAAYQSQISDARSVHEMASGILSTHLGFDASGNVTDLATAKQTVIDARQALVNAANQMIQAVKNLRQAVRAWQAAHPSPTPSATPGATSF
jgi:predicted TIM-barrel enzyme